MKQLSNRLRHSIFSTTADIYPLKKERACNGTPIAGSWRRRWGSNPRAGNTDLPLFESGPFTTWVLLQAIFNTCPLDEQSVEMLLQKIRASQKTQ